MGTTAVEIVPILEKVAEDVIPRGNSSMYVHMRAGSLVKGGLGVLFEVPDYRVNLRTNKYL